MDRRRFLRMTSRGVAVAVPGTLLAAAGCGRQYGHLLTPQDTDMVGSHQAGAAVWNPLVDESVAKLLGRCQAGMPPAEGYEIAAASTNLAPGELPPPANTQPAMMGPAKVCFIGLENKSSEELVDFKEQLYQRIDAQVNSSPHFRMISRRMVDAALRETHLRPDSLFLPHNRDQFTAALAAQGSPVDFLLYGTITSGTTQRNDSTQRDYELTLEMVNLGSGDYVKETAKIRKGYHKSRAGKWWNYGLLQQADG